MMRYYKLLYDYERDDNYVYCNAASIGDMNEYITISGKEIKQWDEVIFEYGFYRWKCINGLSC